MRYLVLFALAACAAPLPNDPAPITPPKTQTPSAPVSQDPDPVEDQTCKSGDAETRACGNCGEQTRTCTKSIWSPWSTCEDEGECAAGATEDVACGSAVGACQTGTKTRTCSPTCEWGAFAACNAVGPAPEVCGDQQDNDCNGSTDEGCACAPVAAGQAGAFAVSGAISKLVAPKDSCRVFALAETQVIVVDTSTKHEVKRINLPHPATDIALSADGTKLVVSHWVDKKVSLIDQGTLAISKTTPTQSDPKQIAINDGGLVYYIESNQWVSIHTLDPMTGADAALSTTSIYHGDIELSADGLSLFAAEGGLSGSNLLRFDLSNNAKQVDQTIYDDDYGFPYPSNDLYLSPNGQHIYYASHQIDAHQLAFLGGKTGERVFAEDAAGTFAIGTTSVFDAKLVRKINTLPNGAFTGVLTSADKELWTFGGGKLRYTNVADLLGTAQLGVRELPPTSLASYTFTALARDPTRDRLYALDKTKGVIVVIEASTSTAKLEIFMGSTPTSMDIDPAGTTLYVGHLDLLAATRVDLQTLTFAGFVPASRNTFEIKALASGRVLTIDDDQWTTPTLIDVSTATELHKLHWGAYAGALTRSADGLTVFVGDQSGYEITRYSVATNQLVQTSKVETLSGFIARKATALPDASGVYYSGRLLDGNDLSVERYNLGDTILTVTPNGKLAISATKIYRVSDGAPLGTLAATSTAQAVSADSLTLYLAVGGGITKVDLSVY